MDKLGERNITLLVQGLKTTGNFTDGLSYVEESMYIDEFDTVFEFCKWADKEIGGGGAANMEILFQAFRFPENKEKVAAAMEIKKEIDDINKRIYGESGKPQEKEPENPQTPNEKYWDLTDCIINYRMEMIAHDTLSYIEDWLLDYIDENALGNIQNFLGVVDDKELSKIYTEILGKFSEMEKAQIAKEMKWFDMGNLDEFHANAHGEMAIYAIIDTINAAKLYIYINTGKINWDTTKALEI